ncbi:hypothetical protein AVEN_3250-1 [Araneus ventricosus]|uniref:Uncharacterized protein n=1 Tax=Araneus ventricosus TaxID=182803 RepID=A0A4Y2FQR6_ARAVE|nr:hypothetical protein AVEN_3250-1 [Araneus ventricosus]
MWLCSTVNLTSKVKSTPTRVARKFVSSKSFTSLTKWNFWNTGKSNRQGRKPMKFGTNDSKRWNSNELKIQHFMRQFQFDTRCEASGTSKDLPILRPRDEARKSEISLVAGRIGG